MKKNIFLILLLLPLVASSQDTIPLHKLVKKLDSTATSVEYTYYNNNKPFTGISIYYYNDDGSGQKKEQMVYENGKQNGLHTWWHENGQKSLECQMINGKINGRVVQWLQDGSKYVETNYKDDKKHGDYISWHENNSKHIEMKYDHDNPVGKIRLWHDNGQLFSIGEGVAVTKDAITFEYDRFSDIKPDTAYILEGMIAHKYLEKGEWVYYYENGLIESKGIHLPFAKMHIDLVIDMDDFGEYTERYSWSDHETAKDGIWKYYSENGKLIREEIYKNGVLLKETKY